MGFLLYLVLTILGFVLAIFIVIQVIKYKISRTIGIDNFNNMMDAVKSTQDLQLEEYTREKNVTGMTKILEPSIIKDFPDFNKELIFNKVEKNLNSIFDAIETKDLSPVSKNDDLVLLKDFVSDEIKRINENRADIFYTDVRFHNHAIQKYEKKNGVATITTSSTLEYYYSNTNNKINRPNIKKQTRYTCKFIYVYDETKIGGKYNVLTIRCPNCGAPLRGLGGLRCAYCGTETKPINLKAWKMSYYKEDYD